jgi:biopolymer transport protein ExbB
MSKNLFETLAAGGPVMVPLVGLSILTIACGIERSLFWARLLIRESKITHDVLEAAKYSLTDAKIIAQKAKDLPIGRFLIVPLKLTSPTPETFRLALETTAEEEFANMRRGDKLLESTVAIAPLLGLLGTVTGLIKTFENLDIGGGGSTEGGGLAAASAGIGESLITTAGGMVVAIMALAFLRIFVTCQAQQEEFFTKVGGDLELIYRQRWYEPAVEEANRALRQANARWPNHGETGYQSYAEQEAGYRSDDEPIAPEDLSLKPKY